MRIKTFSAATMADAMQMVRDQLGADAIILATERAAANGGVIVTAAIEPPRPPDPGAAANAAAAIGAVDAIGAALAQQGVPPLTAHALLDAAADGLGDGSVDALAAGLAARLRFAPLFPDGAEARPLMLVGPPGSGKTVTLAKLAARARLAGRPVAAVTCDTVRAGAVQQLATYAGLLDIPLRRAKTPAALRKAVNALAPSGPVLIDTLGTNPFDAAEMDSLAALAGAIDCEIMLVLAAGGDPAECAEQAAAFARIGATLLFATRLDAVRRIGGVVTAAETAGLALAGLGVSPQIGSGVRAADAGLLARLLMPQAAADEAATGRDEA
ncbi:MAG: GTP-binding protein [Rhodospirillaceae bacterium]|nr:GTP-binding protein [Rhodospirillaceae bacterium]